jgi:hypothetical protein
MTLPDTGRNRRDDTANDDRMNENMAGTAAATAAATALLWMSATALLSAGGVVGVKKLFL